MENTKIRGMQYFEYQGKKYPMILNLRALKTIEDEIGSARSVMNELYYGRRFTTAHQLFVIFVNAGYFTLKQNERVTGDEILEMGMEDVLRLLELEGEIIKGGNKTETGAGEAAGDEDADLYQDEQDEKNA